MPFKAEREYVVRCTTAQLVSSSQKGTPGIWLGLHNEEEGDIEHTLWLSPKTKDQVEKVLREAFGVSPEKLKRPDFFEQIDFYLASKEVQITTKAETYNGKERIRVQWINPVGEAPADQASIARNAASLWSGATDEDIPF